MNKWLLTYVGLLSFSVGSFAIADTIYLQNGDILSGKISNIKGDTIKFKPSFDEKLELKLSQSKIKKCETTTPLTVELQDGTISSGTLQVSEDKNFTLQNQLTQTPQSQPIDNIKEAYTETADAHYALKTSGHIKGGMNVTNGNSDTKNYDLDGKFVAETKKNRFTTIAEYGYSEQEDDITRDRTYGSGKYDYFISDNIYSFVNADFEHDKFQDLSLRTALGAGLGYQFYNEDDLHLGFEAGPNYVNEDYKVNSEDKDYAALRWAFNYDQKLNEILSVFHNHKIVQSLATSNDMIVNARTGFSVPIVDKIQAGFEWRVDWNNNPVINNDRLDQAYMANIGYYF